MPKHESTAINELIDLARVRKPRTSIDDGDGGDRGEVMFRRPSPRPTPQTTAPSPSRGQRRTAAGTQNHPVPAIPAIPALPDAVRMTKAPRVGTIPPLSGAQSFDIGALSTPGLAIPPVVRPARARLPRPVSGRATSAQPAFPPRTAPAGTPAPELLHRRPATVNLPPHSPTLQSPILRDAAFAPVMLDADELAPGGPSWRGAPETLEGVDLPRPGADEASWYDRSPSIAKVDDSWDATVAVEKPSFTMPVRKRKLVAPLAIGGAVIAVIAFGALAFSGGSAQHDAKAKTVATAQPIVAAPAQQPAAAQGDVAAPPAPAPIAQAATPAVAATSIIDVRFDSDPAGATVMLVDGGKTSFLGTTPVSASVDRSRRYDVVFTLANHPTQLQHFDPTATSHIVAALTSATPSPTPAAVAARPRAQRVAASVPATPADATDAADPADDDAGNGNGNGVLMIASKPPCKILIDGKDTGMETPQRNLALPAGAHKVTLVNKDQNIQKVVDVRITPGTPTKVIENLN